MNRSIAITVGVLPLIGLAIHGFLYVRSQTDSPKQPPLSGDVANWVKLMEPSAVNIAAPGEPITVPGTASVTGQVVGVDGTLLPGVPIYYWESNPRTQGNKSASPSDASGRFTINGLSEDSKYVLRFGKFAGNGQDFGFGLTQFPDMRVIDTPLRLSRGERRDIGRVVVWRTDAALAGRLVTRAGGMPAGHLLVVIDGRHTSDSTRMQPDGSFRFRHVVREPLTLAVFRSSDAAGTTFSYGPTKPGEAERRTVLGGNEAVTITLR